MFALNIFLPHTSLFFSFEVATTAANRGSPGLIKHHLASQMKAKMRRQNPSLENFANVFHSKFIPSLVNTFKTNLKPEGKNGKALNSWELQVIPN